MTNNNAWVYTLNENDWLRIISKAQAHALKDDGLRLDESAPSSEAGALKEIQHHIDTWSGEPQRAVRLIQKVLDRQPTPENIIPDAPKDYEAFYNFLMDRNRKPFYIDQVSKWLQLYMKEEISLSRFVELFNQTVFEMYPAPTEEDIEDAAWDYTNEEIGFLDANPALCADVGTWHKVYDAYLAGSKQRASVTREEAEAEGAKRYGGGIYDKVEIPAFMACYDWLTK